MPFAERPPDTLSADDMEAPPQRPRGHIWDYRRPAADDADSGSYGGANGRGARVDMEADATLGAPVPACATLPGMAWCRGRVRRCHHASTLPSMLPPPSACAAHLFITLSSHRAGVMGDMRGADGPARQGRSVEGGGNDGARPLKPAAMYDGNMGAPPAVRALVKLGLACKQSSACGVETRLDGASFCSCRAWL